MSDLTYVVSRALTLDETEYTISVCRNSDNCLAYWECKQCTNQDGGSIHAPDRDTAIENVAG